MFKCDELMAVALAEVAREKVIAEYAAKPISQYQGGLLTFDEFLEQLGFARQAAEAAL